MLRDFTMPKLGHLMEEGTIVAWKKRVGDRVVQGEILLEVESEKGILGAESDTSGTLAEILVPEGRTVAVGTPIARIEAG